MISLKDHLDFPDTIELIILVGLFDELLNFGNFSLCVLEDTNSLLPIIKSNKEIIIKHVIDNADCIDMVASSLIRYLVESNNVKLLDYFVNKYHLGLELQDKGRRPIHFACLNNGTEEMIKYLVNKGVDLEAEDNLMTKPIHLACVYGTIEMVEILVNKGVDLEAQDDLGLNAIHFACRHGTQKMIDFLVSKGANLESRIVYGVNKGWKPIHIVCFYGTYETIKNFLFRNIDLCSNIKKFNGNDIDYGIKKLVSLNDTLTLEQQQELIEIINKKIEI